MKGIKKVALYRCRAVFVVCFHDLSAHIDLAEYRNLFTDVLDKQPQSPVAWNNRGHYYRQQSQATNDAQQRALFLAKAKADYDQALMVDPNYELAYFNRAKVHFENKAYAFSLADYTTAIEKGQKDAKCYTNQGTVYALLNQKEEALADFAQAEALDPNYLELRTNQGILYFNAGEYALAKADFAHYISLDATDPGINNLLGLCYKGLGDMSNGLNYISLAIQYGHQTQDSGLGVFYYNRSLIYATQGKWDWLSKMLVKRCNWVTR